MCSLTAQCSDFNLDKQKVGTQCSLNPSVVLQTRARSTVFLWTLTDHQRSSAAFIETDANRHFQDAVRVIELWLPAPKQPAPDKLPRDESIQSHKPTPCPYPFYSPVRSLSFPRVGGHNSFPRSAACRSLYACEDEAWLCFPDM